MSGVLVEEYRAIRLPIRQLAKMITNGTGVVCNLKAVYNGGTFVLSPAAKSVRYDKKF